MITAIVLAAGQSRRMGRPKMLMPWGKTTVLKQVITVIRAAGIQDMIVVTGGEREKVEAELMSESQVRAVFNAEHARGEMLSSIQCGLREIKAEAEAALICLGDQPQVEERSVRLVCDEFANSRAALIVPSYRMRRGHPWLMARTWWNDFLDLHAPQTPRDFLNMHAEEIHYVNVDTPSVIEDLDTPADYLKYKP